MARFEAREPRERIGEVVEVADRAGAILLRHWRTDFEVAYKVDAFDPVTVADRESDAFIREEIGRLFPADAILSEEHSLTPERYGGRVWMVDPLDDTKAFAAGLDAFSVSIGCVEDGIPIMGAVLAPARGLAYSGGKGLGVRVRQGNETRLAALPGGATTLGKARIITRLPGKDQRPLDALVASLGFGQIIEDGSIALAIARVAAGEADCTICTNPRVSKWDSAGGQALLEAVGGVVSDMYGQPLDYMQAERGWPHLVVASANALLHERFIAALRGA